MALLDVVGCLFGIACLRDVGDFREGSGSC